MRSFPFLSILLLSTMLAGVCFGNEPASNSSVRYIQRTMRMLSGELYPELPVRVLFYGQSITSQRWRDVVTADLTERFPMAKIEFANKAIGGFTSPALIRTAAHDLYPYYPDLLIFHVYGDLGNYEKIIQHTRETTTAEIILWTDHVAAPSRMKNDDQHSEGIREIASKYNCMLIDVRAKWKAHLKSTGETPESYLKDAVHLNKDGEKLLGRLISEEILRTSQFGENQTAEKQIQEVPLSNSKLVRKDGQKLQLTTEGNRLVAIPPKEATKQSVRLSVDGKPVMKSAGVWAVTRPSTGPKIWMPAIKRVAPGVDVLEEDWTLTCLEDSTPDGKKIHFRLEGSVTGVDGEGYSTEDFVSNSGRIRIEARDWHMTFPLRYKKITLPENFQIRWSTYPLCTETVTINPDDQAVVLYQSTDLSQKTISIVPDADKGQQALEKMFLYLPSAK